MTWLARSLALGIGLCCAGVAAAQTPISFVHRAPLFAREGNSVVIEGQMLGASEVESVELVYKSGAEAWRNLEFELVSADHYRVEIPGGEVRPPTLEYYVVAIDFLENRHAALANETQPVQVRVEASPSAATSAAPAPAPPPKPAPKPAPERAATPPQKAAPGALPMPQAAAVDRRAATRVTIIERDTMDAMGARTLLDVLAAAPEIEVWRDVAGFDRVAVRGRGEEGDVLLVIDGLVQNSVYDGRAFWRLPAGVIEQVVIERGAASLRDGMAGLAGTVAVSTRRNQAKRVQAAAGSHLSHTRDGDARTYGSYALVASGGVDAAPAAVTAFAALDLTDGTQATVREDALSSAGLASEAPGPAQDHSLRLAGGAALSLDEIMPGSFTLAGHYLLERRGAQVGLISAYGPASRVSLHAANLQVEHLLSESDKYSLRYRLGVDLQRFTRSFELAPRGFLVGATPMDRDFVEEVSGALFGVFGEGESILKPAGDHRMRLGVLVAHHRGSEPEVRRTLDGLGTVQDLELVDYASPGLVLTRSSVLGRLSDTWQLHADVSVEFGLRVLYVSDVAMEASKQVNPLLRVTYQATDHLHLEAGYGSSYRPPTLAERTDRVATTLPLGLRTDRSVGQSDQPGSAQHTVEIGLTHARGWDRIDTTARAGVFYQRIIDAFAALPDESLRDPETGLTPVGVRPQVDQLGVQVEGRVDLGQEASLHLASWWTRSSDSGERGVTLLTDVAQLGALMSLRLRLGQAVDLNLLARYRAERRNNMRTLDERLRTFTLPADFVVHAAARTAPLWEHVRLGLVAHNLFDAELGDPAPRPDFLPGMVPGEGFQILFTVEVAE